MSRQHPFPKQSPDLRIKMYGDKPSYTADEVQAVVDRHCEALAKDNAKWKSVAAKRLETIGHLKDANYSDADRWPWGTLDDAEHMRLCLTAEVARIDGQLTQPAKSTAWLNSAIGARSDKLREIRRVSDWIDAERLRILRDELRDLR